MSAPTSAPEPCIAGAMELLMHGVPLSLLFDLVLGPRSEELLRTEVSTRPVRGGVGTLLA